MVPEKFSFLEKLNIVQQSIRHDIYNNSAGFEKLIQLDIDELDQTFCPAIVLAMSRSCNNSGEKSEALASIIQYVFMANQIHKLMTDDNNLAEELRQFPVLVGDLLYGKFFLRLCKEDLLHFLAPLARIMGSMSEAGITRWVERDKKLGQNELLSLIGQESAFITAIAARLSAELAGVPVPVQEKLEELGRELGLAWGAWKESLSHNILIKILHHADEIIDEISLDSQILIQPLRELHQYIVAQLNLESILNDSGWLRTELNYGEI